MTLKRTFHNLERRLTWADNTFRSQYRLANKAITNEEVFLLNGLVDYVWQAWNRFSREYFIKCSVGCIAKNGVTITPTNGVTPCTEERISYISTKLNQPNKITATGTNSILRHEPTWGDIDKIISLSSLCALSNHSIITSSFGGGLLGPKHLQLVRNAIAHLNKETYQSIANLSSLYKATKIRHPASTLFWRTVDTDLYALSAWIEDMLIIADIATEA